MSIEAIIFLAVWFVSTEVIFFTLMRDELDGFTEEKLLSILCGLFSVIIIFGFPWLISYLSAFDGNSLGFAVYAWYYGIALFVAAFFGGNYAVHDGLNTRQKKKRASSREKRR